MAVKKLIEVALPLEKINADGSIEISESNAKGLGVISTRTFSAAEAGKFQYVHY